MNSASKTGGPTSVLLHMAAAVLLVIAAHHAQAASAILCAEPYTVDLPGAAGVPMWGYRQVADAASCSATGGARSSTAAPVITVPAGDTTLAITLVNRLTVPTSVVLAAQALPVDGGATVMAADVVGPSCVPTAAVPTSDPAHPLNCRVRSFTGETDPGATRTYTFSNLRAGTFLYQSGTHPQVQVQMGLAGMARVVPGGDAGFDRDVPVVLSEVDADMHGLIAATLGSADPASWKAGHHSTLNYAPRFFLINGRVFTGVDGAGVAATDLTVAAVSGARVGLRIANAGLQSRSLMLNKGTWRLLGEDGYPYAAAREQATVLVAAGKTTDAQLMASVPADGSVDRSLALFDRRAGTDNADGSALGGQVARLALSAPVGPSIDPIAAQVANEGSTFALQVQSANISGYSLATTAPGMSVSAGGLISWPVPLATAVPTAYDVTVSGSDGSTTVSQTFNVRVNHAPSIAPSATLSVVHGALTLAAPGLLTGATDPDGDTPLSAVAVGSVSAGTLTLNANGSFSWSGPQPASGSTPVTFAVAARDPSGLVSAPTTVTLDVAANVVPVAGNDAYTITLARGFLNLPLPVTNATQIAALTRPVNPTLTGNDSDADGSLKPASLAVIAGSVRRINPTTGATIALPGGQREAVVLLDGNGNFRFTPRIPNTNVAALQLPVAGTYEFRYTVADDQDLPSNQAVVRVTVN